MLSPMMSFLFLRSPMITFHAPYFHFILFWWIKYYEISISQLAIRLFTCSSTDKYKYSHLFILNGKFHSKIHIYIRHDPWWYMVSNDIHICKSFLPQATIIVYNTDKYFSLPSENKKLREFKFSSIPLKWYCIMTTVLFQMNFDINLIIKILNRKNVFRDYERSQLIQSDIIKEKWTNFTLLCRSVEI